MRKMLPILFCMLVTTGCDMKAPVPVDSVSLNFGNRNFSKAYTCTFRAAQATGFTIASSQPDTGTIQGSYIAKDDGKFSGTFTVDQASKTITAKIEKHLSNDFDLVYDNKNDIDVLLNQFQFSYQGCY